MSVLSVITSPTRMFCSQVGTDTLLEPNRTPMLPQEEDVCYGRLMNIQQQQTQAQPPVQQPPVQQPPVQQPPPMFALTPARVTTQCWITTTTLPPKSTKAR
jgi:hypothetical protein